MEIDDGAAAKIAESSANVSSAIMLKVPTQSLASLRVEFEKEEAGLNLIQFLVAFVRNMDLSGEDELLSIVPDLVDFFKSVDINGFDHLYMINLLSSIPAPLHSHSHTHPTFCLLTLPY